MRDQLLEMTNKMLSWDVSQSAPLKAMKYLANKLEQKGMGYLVEHLGKMEIELSPDFFENDPDHDAYKILDNYAEIIYQMEMELIKLFGKAKARKIVIDSLTRMTLTYKNNA